MGTIVELFSHTCVSAPFGRLLRGEWPLPCARRAVETSFKWSIHARARVDAPFEACFCGVARAGQRLFALGRTPEGRRGVGVWGGFGDCLHL